MTQQVGNVVGFVTRQFVGGFMDGAAAKLPVAQRFVLCISPVQCPMSEEGLIPRRGLYLLGEDGNYHWEGYLE